MTAPPDRPPDHYWDRLAIERLNQDFCHELDRGTPEGFAALFSEDAIYTRGERRSDGRAEVLAFARGRIAEGPRTSRHFPSGLRIAFEGEDRATGVSACVTYAASALPPVAGTVPVLVADFHDVYVRVGGRWLFAERHIVPVFAPAA